MTNDAGSKRTADAKASAAVPGEETAPSVESSGPRALTPADLPAGTIVDKYRLGNVLGQGGMGLVIAAEHVQLRERVALKFLRADGDTAAGFRSRFRREAQICAQIKNEHITRVIDIGTYKDADYMVMEQLSGHDLRGFMKRNQPIPIETAIDIALQTCEGLAEVHARGVVHRDLKPSNLFVTHRSDGANLIKILDFGISKWASEMDAEEEELTKTGAVLGSPKYMAPEQLFGSNSVDARADVYSLGAILYEMITGKPPFEEPSFARLCVRISSGQPPSRPRERRPEISEELDAVVMLCLEPNIANRLPTVAALAGELLAAVADPHADAIRERLQAVLDGGTLSMTGPNSSLMRSGSYVAQSMTLSRTGSNSGSRRAPPSTASGISAPAHDVEVAVEPAAAPQKNRKVAFVVAALAAVVVIFFMTRRGADPVTTPTAAATVTQPTTAASTAATSAPTPTATQPPTPTATVVASASTTATATGKTVNVGKSPSKAPTGTKTAEPANTPTPATAAPTPVAPATAKEPPKSANPLEDRQ